MPSQSPLTVRQVRHVTVVTFSEPSIVDARVIETVRSELTSLVEKEEHRRLVIDLSRVQHLSSAALGVLVPLQNLLQERQGKLVLCGLRKEIAKVFKLTALHKWFTIREDEEAALSDFGIPPK